SKIFSPGFLALDKVSLDIQPGEVFGLLGLNGAGKTTLLKCLTRLINPTKGEIFFAGKPITSQDVQDRFGFLPESFKPPANLSAREWLKFLSRGLGLRLERADEVLRQVGLEDKRNKLTKTFSRGMIQRLGLAAALLKEPQVIILDEPTLGLDPKGQAGVLEILKGLNQQGRTIFFSSHILSQIETLCHKIGIIHKGRLIFTGIVKEVIAKHNSRSLEEAFLREVS
ncbi:MAG: ABC transporter ATP-binding protein, partial [Candidatus Omnitrophota bacterium]